MDIPGLLEGVFTPTFRMPQAFPSVSLVVSIANAFFEQCEERRDIINESLRKNAEKAMQDPRRLDSWIREDWQIRELNNYFILISL